MEISAELRGTMRCWPIILDDTEAPNQSSDIMETSTCWPRVEATEAANRFSDVMERSEVVLSRVSKCMARLKAREAVNRSSVVRSSANEAVFKINKNDSNAMTNTGDIMFRECSTVVREKITVDVVDFLHDMRQLVDDFKQETVQTSMSDQVTLSMTDQVFLMKEKIETNIEGFIEEVGQSMREAIQTEVAELQAMREAIQTEVAELQAMREAIQTEMTELQSINGKRRKVKGTFSAKDGETVRVTLQKDSETLRATKLEQERVSKKKASNMTIMQNATKILIQEMGTGQEKVSEVANEMAKLSDPYLCTICFMPPTRAGTISLPCQHFLFCGECLDHGLEKLEMLQRTQCPTCGAKMKGTFHFTVSDDNCVELHTLLMEAKGQCCKSPEAVEILCKDIVRIFL